MAALPKLKGPFMIGKFVTTGMFGLLISFTSAANIINTQQAMSHNMCEQFKNSTCSSALSANGEYIASGGTDDTVKIWQSADGKVIHELPHPDGGQALAFSPQGTLLATGDYQGIIRIWNQQDATLLNTFKGHQQAVRGLTYSNSGNLIASVSSDDSIRLWHATSGQSRVLGKHQGDTWGVAFSPDDELVLSGGEDNVIRVWSANTGQLLQELTDHTGAVLEVTFSPDGKWLASGGDDYSIKIWDTQTWQVVKTLTGDFYSVYALRFSPDGQLLISAGRDKGLMGEFLQYHFGYQSEHNDITMQVWDVESGSLLQQLNGHKDDVVSLSINNSGNMLVSSSNDGIVITWPLANEINKVAKSNF